MASDRLASSRQLLVAADRAWWRVRGVRYGALPLDLAAPVRCAQGDCSTRHLTLLPREGPASTSPAGRPCRWGQFSASWLSTMFQVSVPVTTAAPSLATRARGVRLVPVAWARGTADKTEELSLG
jgi:hypothetical protein